MPHHKPDGPEFLRANRIGCFVIAAVIALLGGVIAYIAFSSPSENAQNSVIPIAQ
jgi:hypothetical protein